MKLKQENKQHLSSLLYFNEEMYKIHFSFDYEQNYSFPTKD